MFSTVGVTVGKFLHHIMIHGIYIISIKSPVNSPIASIPPTRRNNNIFQFQWPGVVMNIFLWHKSVS